MTDDELAAFYRRYNRCCNEHRFDDLRQFVAGDGAINGAVRGLDASSGSGSARWAAPVALGLALHAKPS